MSEVLDQIVSFWIMLLKVLLIAASFFVNKRLIDKLLKEKEKSNIIR